MSRLRRLEVTAAVASGGALGALARYALTVAWPYSGDAFPWASLAVNVLGCLLIGVLMTLVVEVGAHRLVRPFLGVGVLGGFTTFSTYALDTLTLAKNGALPAAAGYLLGTMLTALAAVWLGIRLTRAVVRGRRRTRRGQRGTSAPVEFETSGRRYGQR